jgi:tRNA threonylcarbamoyladenosine biosynthesis protein TsaB
MPLILQLETSTDICSVAISENGILLSIAEATEANSHTEVITLLIEQCLKESNRSISELDAIAVSDGPGSYTSLRVGVATAKGMCFATECPLIAIDSIEILANGILNEELSSGDLIIPMIDARRMEVYTCVFNAHYHKIEETRALILEENSFLNYENNNKLHFCGSGAPKFQEKFRKEQYCFHHFQSSAKWMTALAHSAFIKNDFVQLAYYSPNYFKAPNITKSNKKLF